MSRQSVALLIQKHFVLYNVQIFACQCFALCVFILHIMCFICFFMRVLTDFVSIYEANVFCLCAYTSYPLGLRSKGHLISACADTEYTF